MNKIILSLLSLLLMVSCQLKPTKMTSEDPLMSQSLTAESLMQGNPVLLDARPSFEFNISHVPGAVNVRWEDFSQQSSASRGLLQNDLFALARRLSLIGVDPDTKILVLGKGKLGQGEEGRIAWTLKVLGVKNVYTAVHTSFREMNQVEGRSSPEVKNKPYWKPEVQESMIIDLKKFKAAITKPQTEATVLDVRSLEEFNLRNLSRDRKFAASISNLDWKNFIDDKGLPNPKVEAQIQSLGLNKDSQIYVISSHGVRSAVAVYVLQFLGYKNVSNFAGGYEQWK